MVGRREGSIISHRPVTSSDLKHFFVGVSQHFSNLLSHLLYVVSLKIFNMNRGYISKSYTNTRDTIDQKQREWGQL